MSKFLEKSVNILDVLRKTTYIFSWPKKGDILVFDREHSQALFSHLDASRTVFFEPIPTELNVFILLRSLIFRVSYFQSYVDYVKPIIFLTFIDNAIRFLYVKCPKGCKKITVQNGYRSAIDYDLYYHFPMLEKSLLSNDYAFVFNSSVAEEYKKYIPSCKTIEIGSFGNNNIEVYSEDKTIKGILYISSFVSRCSNQEENTFSGVLCHDYVQNELLFIKWLFAYVQTEGVPLTILGRRFGDNENEKKYYSELSGGVEFEYIEKYPGRNSREITDRAESLVTIDSTLGYEALARGSKVAMFPIRGNSYPLNTRKFCWPSKEVGDFGVFWTNSVDYDQWNRILKYVTSVRLGQWKNECSEYIDQSIVFDKDNSKFCALLTEMGLSK